MDLSRLPRFLGVLLVPVAGALSCERAIIDDFGPVASLALLPTPYLDPPAVSSIAGNAFGFTSAITFPCAPYQLVPQAGRTGAIITLRIEGRQKDGCPQDVTGTISYRVDVVNVRSGTYQLRVIQAHREWAVPPDTVFAGQLVVP